MSDVEPFLFDPTFAITNVAGLTEEILQFDIFQNT